MDKKIKTIWTASFTAVLLAIVVVTAVLVNQKQSNQPATAVQGAQASQQQSDTHLAFVATKGKDVLEQLKEHAAVETADSQYGPFVIAINGKKEDGKYWSYYINGQMAQVGAAEYVTQGGEKVEWKLE